MFMPPASAGSRGTLRMNGIGERKRERERERESDQTEGAVESGKSLFFFNLSFYILS